MSIGGVMGGLNQSLNNLNRAQSTQAQSIQRISTGSKYYNAGQGASEYAIIQRMYNNIGSVAQSNSNTQTANSMLNVAAGAVGNTVSSLSSLKQTLISAANGTNGSQDIGALQKSVNQTLSQINSNSQVTYNGQQLLDGSQSLLVAGYNGYETVNLGDMSTKGLGLTDSDGNSTIKLGSLEDLGSAIETVDSALNTALDQATNIGAAQQGLDYQSSNYVTMEESLYDAVSTIGDTDIAAESVNNASANSQSQIALWAIKQGMQSMSQQTLAGLNNHSRGAAFGMLS
ncbi:MAG: bacitracin resistance protein BacA [Anaerovibrio sp.]|uniref:flagellin n=1 Tax=Anaerovibrio sp. TaxID=1872532 RepID=UPI0025CE011B|nr:flagellin [Anaerovibrio sp.]MCR5176561.1 bacitracin resistance protein BacA [Anaerovibrio sp.]